MFVLICGNSFSKESDHIIKKTFGEWEVRHVFDDRTLQHRFSDATVWVPTNHEGKFEFQFNKQAHSGKVQFIIPGWIQKVTITVNEKEYVFTQYTLHTFYGNPSKEFLQEISVTKSPIKLQIIAGRYKTHESVGILPPENTSAVLRWIRAIE